MKGIMVWMGGKGGLSFMQLNLGHFLSFCLDNERVDKLTKMDHRAKKPGNWTVALGSSEKGLERLHPQGLLHTVFHGATILIQFYFDLCNRRAACAQLYVAHTGFKNNALRQLTERNKAAFTIDFQAIHAIFIQESFMSCTCCISSCLTGIIFLPPTLTPPCNCVVYGVTVSCHYQVLVRVFTTSLHSTVDWWQQRGRKTTKHRKMNEKW